MHFSTALVLASVGFAAAQSTTSSAIAGTSSCAAQTILDTCVSQYQPQLNECAGNDWACLCNSATNLKTCYNNCPGDQSGVSVEQQVQQYCAAAKQFGSSTSTTAKAAATANSTSSGSSDSSASTTDSSSSPTGSTGSASSSSSNAFSSPSAGAADGLVIPTGGALAILLGIFGML